MRVSNVLPPPEVVAKSIIEARKERALLRRLYRLVLDAKESKKPGSDPASEKTICEGDDQ